MLEYRSAIVDECGSVVYWCDELIKNEVNKILVNHPEWYISCFPY